MKRRLATAATVIAVLIVGGCSGIGDGDDSATSANNGRAEGEVAEDADGSAADSAGGGEGNLAPAARVNPAPRQVIHHVDVTVAVDDVGAAAQRAATLAQTSGGFVADESTDGDESATLTLRVPSEGHTEVVGQLEQLGNVRERNRSAEDVTEDVVDVEARIASQHRSIDRIRVLLDQANDIDDVVRIESELAQREAELDSLLQRQEELSGLTALATVTVTFVSTAEDEADLGFLTGLRGGWDAFVEAAKVATAIIGAILPFAIAAAVIGLPLWMGLRRHRRMAPAPPST